MHPPILYSLYEINQPKEQTSTRKLEQTTSIEQVHQELKECDLGVTVLLVIEPQGDKEKLE